MNRHAPRHDNGADSAATFSSEPLELMLVLSSLKPELPVTWNLARVRNDDSSESSGVSVILPETLTYAGMGPSSNGNVSLSGSSKSFSPPPLNWLGYVGAHGPRNCGVGNRVGQARGLRRDHDRVCRGLDGGHAHEIDARQHDDLPR